ncbi:MAG: hypothetical protein ABR562_01985 [Thermoplasmatota archaeon]
MAAQHHPLCDWFASDRFRLGSRFAVCSGCAMMLPGLFLGLVGAALLLRRGVGAWPLLATGLVLGAPQLVTYVVRLGRPARAAIKLLGGIGLGAVTAAWFLLPVSLAWRWGGAGAFSLVLVGMQMLRLRSILRTCKACPWAMDWENCPGFRLRSGPDPR